MSYLQLVEEMLIGSKPFLTLARETREARADGVG